RYKSRLACLLPCFLLWSPALAWSAKQPCALFARRTRPAGRQRKNHQGHFNRCRQMVACSTISFNHGMRFEAQDELATHYKMGKPLAGRLKVEWDEHRQRQASFAERPRSAEDCKSAQRGL